MTPGELKISYGTLDGERDIIMANGDGTSGADRALRYHDDQVFNSEKERRAMKDIRFIGWCNETDDKGSVHDKIWGIIFVQGELVSFWGKRTAKLTFKRVADYGSGGIDTLCRNKVRKGYAVTTFDHLASLDPDFEDRFDNDLMYTIMSDKYHKVK